MHSGCERFGNNPPILATRRGGKITTAGQVHAVDRCVVAAGPFWIHFWRMHLSRLYPLDTAVCALAARHATRIRLDLPLVSHKPPSAPSPEAPPRGAPPAADYPPDMPPPPQRHARTRRGRVVIRSAFMMQD
jgi:hypothetical protein